MAAARSATAKIDWPSLATKLNLRGPTANALTSFKKRNDDARRRLNALQQQPTTLDFASYRSQLKNTAIVSEMESQLNSFKPASYDVSKVLKGIEAFEKAAVASAGETARLVEEEMKDLKATLGNIEGARPFEECSVEDIVNAEPEIERKVENHVRNHRWMPEGYKEKFGDLSVL